MRLLFLTYAACYPWKGGRTLEGRLADTLAKDNEVTLCSEKPVTYLEDEKPLFKRNIVLAHPSAKSQEDFQKFAQNDLAEIEKDEYDLMVISSPSSAPFAAYVKRKLGIPLFTEIHDIPTWRFCPDTAGHRNFIATWNHWLSGVVQSDIVFACHNVTKTHLLSMTNYPEERVRVVYHGVDREMADKVPKQREENSISFCARHVWYKSLDLLIKAASRVKNCPKVKIIGAGPMMNAWRELASRLKVKAEFLGAVDDIAKFTQLKKSKFSVYPSTAMDIGGLSPMEVALCEKPCIVFDQPVNQEIFGPSCEYVEYKNVRELARMIQFFNEEKEFRRSKGLFANWWVRRNRTLEVQAREWMQVFEEVVKVA